MPILDVDKAGSVIVLKRSMNTGFAGIDNPLFYDEKTSLLFGDAKESVQRCSRRSRSSRQAPARLRAQARTGLRLEEDSCPVTATRRRRGRPAASARAASTSARIARSDRDATTGSHEAVHVDVGAAAVVALGALDRHERVDAVGANELAVAEGDHPGVALRHCALTTIVACPAVSSGSHGHMSEEEKDEKTEHEQKMEQAKEEIHQLEEDPPDKLEDWPDGQAKYETFGGAEGDHSTTRDRRRSSGPDSVRHHEDGSVEVGGEKADDPDEFKGEPIPGGPTDPDAKSNPDEQRLADDDEDGDREDDTSEDTSEDDTLGGHRQRRPPPPRRASRRLARRAALAGGRLGLGRGGRRRLVRKLVRLAAARRLRLHGRRPSRPGRPGPTPRPTRAPRCRCMNAASDLGGVCLSSAARSAAGAACARRSSRAPSDGTTTHRCRLSMPSAIALPALESG